MILLHRLITQNFKQLADVQLTFPERGTILIEGHNEAGKSSLFEAVYFALYGDPLTKVNIAELKGYGADAMRVELEFSIDGRHFVIERRLRSSHTVTLICPTPDGNQERITGSRGTDRRIQEELAISAPALLNTCFVEQKKLDQLESLETAKRMATINELLNIRALGLMQESFKITREDHDRVQEARQRVEIAQLDAQLPELDRLERIASRCLLYRQALDCRDQQEQLQCEIGEAEAERTSICVRLDLIAADLELAVHLERQSAAARNDLPLRNAAWQSAIRTHAEALEAERLLLALRAELPQREVTLAGYRNREQDLRSLEALEATASELSARLQTERAELQGYDDLLLAWESGRTELQDLEAQRDAAERAQHHAEVEWNTRQQENQRDQRLGMLLQSLGAYTDTSRDIQTLTANIEAAQESERALPDALARLETLREMEQTADRHEKATQRLAQVEENLSGLHGRKGEYDRAREQLTTKQEEEAQLAARVDQSRQQEQMALRSRQQAEGRAALLGWIEAAERSAEADPYQGKLADLERRLAQNRESVERAQAEATEAGRRQVPGTACAIGGLLIALIAFATPFVLPIALLGVIALATGAVMAVKARQQIGPAKQRQEEAQNQSQQLAGERKLLQGMVTAFEGQLEQRKAELEARSQALVRLNLAVPAKSDEARAAVAAMPNIPLADSALAYDEAKTERDDLERRHQVLQGQIVAERERLERQNIDAVIAKLCELQEEQARLWEEAGGITDALQQMRNTLQLNEGREAIREALEQQQHRVAELRADVQQIPTWQTQLTAKQEQAGQTWSRIEQAVTELQLPGTGADAWQSTARNQRDSLARQRTAVSDETLRAAWQQAESALRRAREAFAVQQNRQQERQERLNATDRETLRIELQQTTREVETNDEAQRPLLAVREQLREAELPAQSAALEVRLAAIAQEIVADAARVADLPAQQQRVEQAATQIASKALEFAQAWIAYLADYPAPTDPTDAEQRLPRIHATLVGQLEGLNVPERRHEQGELQKQERALAEDNASRRDRQHGLSTRETQLFDTLGIPEEERDAALDHHPELQQAAQHSATEWQKEWDARHTSVVTARAQRNTRAGQIFLDDMPLDLDAERQGLGEREKELDVKRRAKEIVELTRRAIVDRVMPMTLDNVRHLLPALTQGRYQDLKWEGDADSLQIYDSRAGDFQQKKVFSGGAKDQISLALRLGFALATLPTGKTTRPYWLFLDEPLSSFDRERTRALVDLLTRGIVRKHFHQIFLISHSESFDAGLFDYRIRMENGAVVESTLP